MGGVLLYESISRTLFNKPHIWVVEMAQFLMAAYYLLGGGYSMILKGHVRMDLLYGRWSEKKQALADLITGPFLMFYLIFLLVRRHFQLLNMRYHTGKKIIPRGRRPWRPSRLSWESESC